MELGAFSISLAVKDLAASRDFYARLGFVPIAGDGEHWQILRNGGTVLGLFQGMFERNTLTFNPGWRQPSDAVSDLAQLALPSFTDVRALKREATAAGLAAVQDTTDDAASGPASFVLLDPDGNPVLFDQHV